MIITTGAIALLLFIIGVIALSKSSALLACYLVGCSVLILPWPYTDPRFWLPIDRVPKWVLVGYMALFLLTGFGAMGYSTWLTFSGSQFPDRYGDGELRSAYAAYCSVPAASSNREALNLLRRYEWHCEAKQ